MRKISALALLLGIWAGGPAMAGDAGPGIDAFNTAAIAPTGGVHSNTLDASEFGRPPSEMALELIEWSDFANWRSDGSSNTLGLVISHCGTLTTDEIAAVKASPAGSRVLVAIGCPSGMKDEIRVRFIDQAMASETSRGSPEAMSLPLVNAASADCNSIEQAALASTLSGVVVFANEHRVDGCSLGYHELLRHAAESPGDRARLKMARAEIMRLWFAVE